jgi:hypothetical protein
MDEDTEAQHIERDLRTYLKKHPAEAGRFLTAVSDALKNYEKAQADMRNWLADRAILNLLSAELVEREEYTVPVLLPAFLHQFPNGLGRNRATCEKLTWRAFVRKASAYFAKEHGSYRARSGTGEERGK